MADKFEGFDGGLEGPIRHHALAPAHDTDFGNVSRYLWVGAAGNLEIVDKDDNAVVWTGIPAGTLLPVRAKKLVSTGTTVANTAIVVCW